MKQIRGKVADESTGKDKSRKRTSVKKAAGSRVSGVLLAVLFTAGIALLAYPGFSDWWNTLHQSEAVASYMETISQMEDEDFSLLLEEAEAYNRTLSSADTLRDLTKEEMAVYEKQLALKDTEVMGYIEIPVLEIMLPVYHGTDERVLQTAVGHLPASSLPVGGEGTHCVLSGHRGLPSARLFTDLDRMKAGDLFVLKVLNRTLTYEVEQILTVEPSDVSALRIEAGKDLCTLVTCTPYGINTHRLLVRGRRTENAAGEAEESTESAGQAEDPYGHERRFGLWLPLIPVMILFLLLLLPRRKSQDGKIDANRRD